MLNAYICMQMLLYVMRLSNGEKKNVWEWNTYIDETQNHLLHTNTWIMCWVFSLLPNLLFGGEGGVVTRITFVLLHTCCYDNYRIIKTMDHSWYSIHSIFFFWMRCRWENYESYQCYALEIPISQYICTDATDSDLMAEDISITKQKSGRRSTTSTIKQLLVVLFSYTVISSIVLFSHTREALMQKQKCDM